MNQTQILLNRSIIQLGSRQLKIQDRIGEGLQADVYDVIDINTNELMVLKHQKNMTKSEIETNLLTEIKGKNYKNIVNVIDFVSNQNEKLILMEKCECDLLEYLTKINNDDFRYLASEICRGLKVIHDLKFIHRDIKPENIMIFKLKINDNRISQPILKLGDFGIIQHIQTDKKTMFSGTPYYLAPEQLQIDNNINYTQAVDIWALAAVFYEMWTKQILFQGQTVEEIYNNILNLDITKAISKLTLSRNYQELLIGMLNRDAKKRLTIEQVLDKLKPNLRLTKSTNIRQLNRKITINNRDYILLDTICSNKDFISNKAQDAQSKIALHITKYYNFNNDIYQTMSIISKHNHKNWLNIYDLEIKDNSLIVIMEKYSETLYDGIIKCQKIDPKDFRYIALELSRGLYELHKCQLIHSNINPKTTMMVKHQDQKTLNTYYIYKIGDFSQAQKVFQKNEEEDYMAPEQRNQQKSTLTQQTDIWQLGVLLFELCTQKKYNHVEDKNQAVQELQIAGLYKNLLQQMLNEQANNRPNSEEICKRLSLNLDNQNIQQVQGNGKQIFKSMRPTSYYHNYNPNNQSIRENRFK